ncbi:MAG TPA: phage tail protein, partial [Chloroflexota bacterium]|nr:phage tail protein [Chloroflexota bacterium]
LRAGESVRLLFVVHPPVNDPDYPLGRYEFAIHVETEGAPAAILDGVVYAIAAGAATLESKYIRFLPRIYQSDQFLSRFLLIFQSLLDPVEQSVDNIPNYIDPDLTPPRFLPWLASWVGVTLDPDLDESTQRTLIRNAVRISRWKGTRRGLREELQIRSGARPLIVENFDGMRVGQDAALGMNTYLGAIHDGSIAVTLATSSDRALALADAERLIAEIKPAHVGQIVRLVAAPNGHAVAARSGGSTPGQALDRGERSG